MAKSFNLLTVTDMDLPGCAEYFSITIVGEGGRISFDVAGGFAIFGDGEWDGCAKVDSGFVDVLESTITVSEGIDNYRTR